MHAQNPPPRTHFLEVCVFVDYFSTDWSIWRTSAFISKASPMFRTCASSKAKTRCCLKYSWDNNNNNNNNSPVIKLDFLPTPPPPPKKKKPAFADFKNRVFHLFQKTPEKTLGLWTVSKHWMYGRLMPTFTSETIQFCRQIDLQPIWKMFEPFFRWSKNNKCLKPSPKLSTPFSRILSVSELRLDYPEISGDGNWAPMTDSWDHCIVA